MMLKPLIFFGTEDFSAASLEALIEAGWPIRLVVTKADSRRGRGRQTEQPLIKKVALKSGINVVQPQNVNEIAELIQTDDLGVLVAYGKIISAGLIDKFQTIVNVHPSLLPKYRGPSPIEAAILNGDSETGVSLMKLTARMDAGPVYIQQRVTLDGNETKLELYEKLASIGAELLVQNLEAIANHTLEPKEQNDAESSYTTMLASSDGEINWREPAQQIERKVRAYLGYPKCKAQLLGQDIVILESRVASGPDDGDLVVECIDSYLEIVKLIGPSGRQMSGADFLRGYKRG